MPGIELIRPWARFCWLLGWLAIAVPCAAAAQSQSDAELVERLRDCAKVEGQEERAECLQALANQTLRDDSVGEQADSIRKPVEEKPKSQPQAAAKTVIVETAEKPIKGVLRECRKSYSGAYLFYFEDGQIWKQVDTRRKRFKNCDWPVTIVKDGFGYKMLLDAETYIRVKRLK